jgi:hypothetical protein
MNQTPTCRSRHRSRSRCRSHRCRRPRTWTPASRLVTKVEESEIQNECVVRSHCSASPAAGRYDPSDTHRASPSTDYANQAAYHPDPSAALCHPPPHGLNSGASDASAGGKASVRMFLRRPSLHSGLRAVRLPRLPLQCSGTRVLTMVAGGLARGLRRVRGAACVQIGSAGWRRRGDGFDQLFWCARSDHSACQRRALVSSVWIIACWITSHNS